MHVERLGTLASVLESYNGFRAIEIDGKRVVFDLYAWQLEVDHPMLATCNPVLANDLKTLDCGTTCCAVGLATMVPEFKSQGFELKKGWDDQWVPVFGEHRNWTAVRAFFDLSEDQANDLFNDAEYEGRPVPSDVAKRIRELLATA